MTQLPSGSSYFSLPYRFRENPTSFNKIRVREDSLSNEPKTYCIVIESITTIQYLQELAIVSCMTFSDNSDSSHVIESIFVLELE